MTMVMIMTMVMKKIMIIIMMVYGDNSDFDDENNDDDAIITLDSSQGMHSYECLPFLRMKLFLCSQPCWRTIDGDWPSHSIHH